MAGKPLTKKLFADLETAAQNEGKTAADFLYDYIADGGSVKSLAAKLGFNRSHVSKELNGHPEFRKVLDDAKKQSAEAMIEDASEMADEMAEKMDNGADVRSERIAVLREQINMRKFRAASRDPQQFGKQDNHITINLGDLHLDALRKTRSNVIDITPSGSADDE
jgi:uncharacterized protein with PIN domain